VLLEAIESFTGTVIFVSHDRYFLEKLATKVLEVKDGLAEMYPGSYAEFIRDREAAARGESLLPSLPPTGVKAGPAAIPSEHAPIPAVDPAIAPAKDRPRKLNPIKLKQLEDRCAYLEEEVPRIEAAILHTESALGNYVSTEETQRQTTLLESLRAQLTTLTAEWEELMTQLEEQASLA
jgi:ATP-binding cassette subfamily F protein 3